MLIPVPLGLQEAVEHEADKWAALWNEGHEYVLPNSIPDPAEHPGPISLQMFDDACRSFPCNTGLRWDKVQPRALL